jgi:hypothetical protein
MKIASDSTKDIFLNAARYARAVHFAVHLEERFKEMNNPSTQLAFQNADTLRKTLADTVPTLWSNLISPLVFPLGPRDSEDRSYSTSGLTHNFRRLVQSESIEVALLSGFTGGACVEDTRRDCLPLNVIPIMVVDAISPALTPDTRHIQKAYTDRAARNWGDKTLIASVNDVYDWVQELDAA